MHRELQAQRTGPGRSAHTGLALFVVFCILRSVAVRYSGAGERKSRPRTVRFPPDLDAWLVAVGKRHRDGIYRLSEFGSPIEALRYYRKLPPAGTS